MNIAYSLALGLSVLFLFVYLTGAFVSKLTLGPEGKTRKSFNLGLPSYPDSSELFAISMVSAATNLSTVFVAFFVLTGRYGYHLLICPITYAIGALLAIRVYRKISAHGYMDDDTGSGLLPRFAQVLTGSRSVAVLMVIASGVPVLAVLVLELRFGIQLFDNLFREVASGRAIGLWGCAVFLILLLGYVFIGGFRAVVTSDVWQYRAMKAGIGVSLVAFVVAGLQRPDAVATLLESAKPVSSTGLVAFYTQITVINLFYPLCFATSWQRFYAFQAQAIDYRRAAFSIVRKVTSLWVSIIFIAILAKTLFGQPGGHSANEVFFLILRNIADGSVSNTYLQPWFQYLVFPLLVAAAFSGMYSTSDTCVSGLLYYILESTKMSNRSSIRPLSRGYYAVMSLLFCSCLVLYNIALRNDPVVDVQQLEVIATAIFGNAVLIAPTVLLLSVRSPKATNAETKQMRVCVLTSILLGFSTHWLLFMSKSASQWAIPFGLAAASVPVLIVVAIDQRARAKRGHYVRVST